MAAKLVFAEWVNSFGTQIGAQAPRQSVLEDITQQSNVVEATMPALGKGGVVRDAPFGAELAELAIDEVEVDLIARSCQTRIRSVRK